MDPETQQGNAVPPSPTQETPAPTPQSPAEAVIIDQVGQPKSSKKFLWVGLVAVLLVVGIGFLFMHWRSSAGALPAANIPSSWLSIDTGYGTLKYPEDNVKAATTTTNIKGALILYSNGRTISTSADSSVPISATESQLEIDKTSEVTVNGLKWTVHEVKFGEAQYGKTYFVTANTTKNGKPYSIVYSQGDDKAMLGGQALTDDAIAQIRQAVSNLIAGIQITE